MNIAITNYCNLKCPYCFANKFIESEKEMISEDQLDKILDFSQNFLRQKKSRIGIIGGEPTLHPNFIDIVNKIDLFSITNNLEKPMLFTNGTLLKNYDPQIFNKINALINLNNPNTIGQEQWKNIETGLRMLEYTKIMKYINFGINLYHNMPDFTYIFEIAQEYNKDHIRCSFVAPNKNDMTLKDDYYQSGKELFLNFINISIKYNIKIGLDCNRIPICYFTDKEKELIFNSLMKPKLDINNFWCNPVIDITPDFKAISCFGISEPVDLSNFKNLNDVEHYFKLKQIPKLTEKNNKGKCLSCLKFENGTCQGGCLSFANKKQLD